MTKISNYDQFDYDYEHYWQNRQYEDQSEKIILKKYLKNIQGNTFVDIGGSFGRNLPLYYENFTTPIILDYSLKTLQKNRSKILKKYPKTELIAANAYKMPFKDATIDTSLMVRVLHHLENQEELFAEVSRITSNKGTFILEYANKMHIKAVLKWIFTLNFGNFSIRPYQQPNQNNFEGTKEGETTVFLNYHPKYIKHLLSHINFKIEKKKSCSFLRINLFKRVLPLGVAIAIEKFMQTMLSWTNIAPSIILKTKKLGSEEKTQQHTDLSSILCCPSCKQELVFKLNSAKCKKCKNLFKKHEGVWDFRV